MICLLKMSPVYITGVGTEDDGDEAEAQQMLRQGRGGIYQTFTQFESQPAVCLYVYNRRS